jgi:hypothetical protein
MARDLFSTDQADFLLGDRSQVDRISAGAIRGATALPILVARTPPQQQDR